MPITGRQIRAARALLDWEAARLADKCDLSRETIANIENNLVQPRAKSLEVIEAVFSAHNVEFTVGQGVRFKQIEIEVFEGKERFDEFYDFLYQNLVEKGGEVCLSVSDESLLRQYRSKREVHQQRMRDLYAVKPFAYRILACKSSFQSDYATYRYKSSLPSQDGGFYCFGDCLVLLTFTHNNPPYVVVLRSAPIAQLYRKDFEMLWESADPPPQSDS